MSPAGWGHPTFKGVPGRQFPEGELLAVQGVGVPIMGR